MDVGQTAFKGYALSILILMFANGRLPSVYMRQEYQVPF